MIESEALDNLLQRWKSGVDKPFKGMLIDYHEYVEEESLSCMCAQGQILHVVGGFQPIRLVCMDQYYANKKVADILQIPLAHSRLLYAVNDNEEGAPYDVLHQPEKYLGPNAEVIIAGWDIEFKHSNGLYQIDLEHVHNKINKANKLYSIFSISLTDTPFSWNAIATLSNGELTPSQKAQALDAISRYKEQYT